MGKTVTEYAIEWLSPAEMQGSVTVIGTGLFARDQACHYLETTAGLPGELRGKVVSRTITWSDWREEKQDVSSEYLPGPTRIWQIDTGF